MYCPKFKVFYVFLLIIAPIITYAQITDCAGAEVLCSDGVVSFNPSGIGSDDFANGGNNAGCLLGDENQSAWYYFEFDGTMPAGSQIEFTIDPNGGSGEDYDFAVFGPDVDCSGLGSPIRCSFAASSCGFCPQTGLGNGASDNSEGAGGDGFVAPLTVNPGQGFYLLVDNWLGSSNGFDLTWGGSAAPFLNCNADPSCELEAVTGPDITVCDGDPNPVLQGSALNSMGGAIFNWVELNGQTNFLSNPNIPNPTVNLPNGYSGTLIFQLTVTEGSCDANAQVTITVSPSPTANITGDLDFCTGTTTILDAGPGHDSYQWSNGSNAQSIQVFMGGTYSVTVSNAAGCSDVATVNVLELPNPTPQVNGDQSICLGGTGTLDAGPGYSTYLWSDLSMTQTITTMFPGPYSVTVSDANGCIGVANFFVDQAPAPTPVITGDLGICTNGTATLDAGGPYTAYIWSDGGSAQFNTVDAPGTYTVTITDLNGCVGEGDVTVFPVPDPEPNIIGDLDICPGETTTLDAGNGYDSYLWSDNTTGQIIAPDQPGNYSVTVTNADGCEGVDVVTVSALSDPMPTVSGDLTICPGVNTNLVVNENFQSYVWSTSGTNNNINTNQPGTYEVTVTDNNGCEGTTSVTVTENIPPTPSINGVLDICPEGNTSLDAGAGYSNYNWSTNDNTQNITAEDAGTYSVTVTDAEGCEGIASVMVNEFTAPSPTITGDDSFCEGNSTIIDAGAGYSTYTWPDGSNGQQLEVNSPGSYTVTVVDGNGCEGTAEIDISELSNPTPTIDGLLEFCEGASTVLSGATGYSSYEWQDGSTNPNFTVNSPGIYTLDVVDNNGCEGSTSVTVDQLDLPSPQFVGETEFCEGSTTIISLNETYNNYQWSTNESGNSIEIGTPGTYSVVVTDANGCEGNGTINIIQNANPVPDINGVLEFCEGLNTTLTGEAGYQSYAWSNGTSGNQVLIENPGPVTLAVIDMNGCEGSQTVNVDQIDMPMPTISGVLEYCENDATLLSVEQTYSTYQWSNNSPDQQILVSTPGTYSVTVSSGDGCIGETSVQVVQNDLPDVSIIGDLEFCENDNTTLEATAGFVSYQWSDNSVGQSIVATQAGTYSVEVTDQNGCMETAEVDVSVNALPDPQILGELLFCEEGSTNLSLGESYVSYEWSTGSAETNIEVSTPGNYSVLVTDANNCQNTVDVDVALYDTFVPEITGAPSICAGEPTTLVAEDGYTDYSWSTGDMGTSITISQAGTYALSVLDVNGCEGTASFEIMENELPTPTIEGQFYFCAGDATSIEVPETYVEYEWSNNESGQSIDVSVAGNYVVTVTDANGCEGLANIFVAENDLPEPDISGLLSFCPEGNTELSAVGNFESYTWSTGENTTVIETNFTGDISLEVVDSFGCVGTTAVTTEFFQVDIPDINGATSFCPDESTALMGEAGFASYNWSTGSIQPNIEIDMPGTYGLTVEDSNGCITENDIQIDLFTVSDPQITGDDAFCEGENVTLTAETGYVSYEWSNQSQAESIQINEEGEYFLTVTDANGCETNASFFVEENNLPNVQIGGSASYCIGGSTTLNAGGTYAIYNWSDGSDQATLEVTMPGIYGLTVTDDNGCMNEASLEVIEATELSPVITGVPAFCPDESTIIDAGTGFATYQWSNSSLSQTLEINTPGIYSVTVTDDDGCVGTDEVEVIEWVPPTPEITGPGAFCEGESISLNTAVGFEDYLWSTGSTSLFIDVDMPGDYGLTVTDDNGCVGETSASVEELGIPVIQLVGQDFYCEGSSTELSVSSSQTVAAYEWSDNSYGSTLLANQPGIYSVTITNEGGCSETAEIQIDEIPTPNADAGLNSILDCDINSVILGGDASTQGSEFSYQWSGPGIDSFNEDDLFPEVFLAGTYTLIVTDDVHNCVSEAATVEVEDLSYDPQVIVQALDILDCSTSTIVIDGSGSESGNSIVYQWFDENGNMIEGANSPMLETSQPELFILEVLDTLTGCYSSASVQVEADVAYPIAEAGLPQLLNCYVPELMLDGTASTTGDGIIYNWSTFNGSIVAGADEIMSQINQPGVYFITVIDTINNCQNMDSVLVSQDIQEPMANAGLDQELDCLTPEVALNGSGSSVGANYTYEWFDEATGMVIGTSTQINVPTPGDYTIVVTDLNNGCTASDLVEVTENGSFPSDIMTNLDDPTCFGDEDGSIAIQQVIGGTPPYVYSMNGEEFNSNTLFTSLGAGTYEITVQDAIGCEYSTVLDLEEGNDLVLNLGDDIYIDLGESTTIQAFSNVPIPELNSFSWNTRDTLGCLTCPEHEVRPFETTEYAATIMDDNGCVATDLLTVFVNHPDEVFIPNAFSPNNDGINDVLMVFAGEDVAVIKSFLVFNRWGETVFDVYNFPPNDPAFGWDGDYRSKRYNNAVFVYMAEVEFIDGTVKLFKGDVAIIK
jgi:gliding motility-associated-like protein